MTAVLNHVVIRCAACGTVVLEADTFIGAIDCTLGGWLCAGAECEAERSKAERAAS